MHLHARGLTGYQWPHGMRRGRAAHNLLVPGLHYRLIQVAERMLRAGHQSLLLLLLFSYISLKSDGVDKGTGTGGNYVVYSFSFSSPCFAGEDETDMNIV